MSCSFCETDIYIKVIRYTAPILAPLTPAQELRDKLINLTGETFAQLNHTFCPICGEKLKEKYPKISGQNCGHF